jgi:hypothetical protein
MKVFGGKTEAEVVVVELARLPEDAFIPFRITPPNSSFGRKGFDSSHWFVFTCLLRPILSIRGIMLRRYHRRK